MTARIPLAAVLCGVLALTACTNPANLDPNANRTRDGAILGGTLGAAAGLMASTPQNRVRNTALGAVFGAAVGGAVGNRLDQQAAALQQSLGDDRVTVTNTGEALVVTLPQDILFDTGSATLRPDLQRDLSAVAANLQAYPDSQVDVIGHTDNTGEAAFNQELSARRAGSVAAVLVSSGVSSARVRTIGRGEDAPIATNLTPEGRAQNRRVEIVIRPTA